MSSKQKAQIRAKLRKQVKKNPGVIRSKKFVKKASLVNFKLPITVRLRSGDFPGTAANEGAVANPNQASIDLGASLGKREVDLGGALAGELQFKDSYDGGALGNVELALNPSSKKLTSTSIPLLWNSQVTQSGSKYDANFINPLIANGTYPGPMHPSGCADFTGATDLRFGFGNIDPDGPGPAGLVGTPGFPFHSLADPAGNPEGFLPVTTGVDDVNKLSAAKNPGDINALGGTLEPFPTYTDSSDPYAATTPSVKDTVLRTSPLQLGIAQQGTQVDQKTNTNGVIGSQNIVIGKSGGQANLFGNIPGKSYGIDVTVSLATQINSIFRIVDQDITGANLVEGDNWPAGIFNCRQVYSGAVDNYIPDVRLSGTLKIAPGITSDGHLRIAKATLQSPTNSEARFAVAACLVPYAGVDAPLNNSDDEPYPAAAKVPTPSGYPGTQPPADLPANPNAARAVPTGAPCNSTPVGLVKYSALGPDNVTALLPADTGDGYTVTNSGSVASIAADLSVGNVSADILIGDV